MIRVLLLFVSAFLFSQFCAKGQASTDWVWSVADTQGLEPKGMAIDLAGNINTLDIRFLKQFNKSGSLVWQVSLTNTSQGVITNGLSVDGAGNIYITGYFSSTVVIDTISITSKGQIDIFLAKFNQNGKVQWVRTAGGTGNPAPMPGAIDDAAFALAVDAAGNSYIAGKIHTINTAVQFDSITIPPNSGSGFGAKYDTNGKIKWVWMLGGPEATKIALGTQGSIFYSWGPSIAKFNSNGTVAWFKTNSGTGRLQIKAIGTDNAGNCYFTGDFSNSITLGTNTFTANGGTLGSNMFLAKYDLNGNIVSAIQSSGGYTTVEGLAFDLQGHPHVTGSTNGTVSFGANFAITTGNEDVFAMKFDALIGAPVWAQTGGSSGIDAGLHLKTLSNGDCLVAGRFYSTATFGNFTIQPYMQNSSNNAFLAKISLNPLGVPETAFHQNLLLYPNPAVSEFSLKSEETGPVQLQVFNLAGAKVWEGTFEKQALVSVQNWPAGMYLVKLTSHGNTLIRKLAVVR